MFFGRFKTPSVNDLGCCKKTCQNSYLIKFNISAACFLAFKNKKSDVSYNRDKIFGHSLVLRAESKKC